MNRLVLFCGGPAIYPGGVPKPLQVVHNFRTLLELYLETPFAASYTDMVLLCESDFMDAFQAIVKRSTNGIDISLVETPIDSSTRLKVASYLSECSSEARPVVWTYPDIFYFDNFTPPIDIDWSERAVLTVRAMTSRFPRIMKDPYSGRIRSITTHQSVVSANPAYLFGGHFVASPCFVSSVLSAMSEQESHESSDLEFDVFSWIINRGLADSVSLESPWLQADGPRDLRQIAALMGTRDSVSSIDFWSSGRKDELPK